MNDYVPNRRAFLAGLACAATSTQMRAAQSAAALDNSLMFAINEAATAAVSIPELVRRYDPLTKVLSRVSAKPVETRPFIDVRLFLDELGKRPPPAFIFAKTVDILADQIANTRYVPVVKINKPYVAGIILAEGSKAKTLHDLIGTDVLLPPPETMTAKLAMAAFHDAGIQVVAKDQKETFPTNIEGKVTVRHVQYQEVIPSTVNLGYWYQAGAVNPTMMGKWRGKVLLKFKPQPNWSIAAFAETPPAVVAAATAAFTSLHESADGAAALAAMKIERFVLADRAEYVELANYVK